MDHPDYTCMGDRVLFFPPQMATPHVAFVTKVHSEHCADLVYYCTKDHAWKEYTSATFDQSGGCGHYSNPEA